MSDSDPVKSPKPEAVVAASGVTTQAPATAAPTAPAAKATPENAGKRRRLLLLIALVVIVVGIGYGVWYFLVGSHYESTDDAYVAGNVVQVTPQVAGTVIGINADDTDIVKQGQDLVVLDPSDARVALDQAEAQLAQTVREVRTVYANNGTLQANIQTRQADTITAKAALLRAQDDYQRRAALVSSGAVSKEELQHVQSELDSAKSAVAAADAGVQAAKEQLASNQVSTDGTSVARHPNVMRSAARVREAYLALERGTLPAPVSGQVAKRSVQLGQRVAPGTPLMAIVPLDQLWVDANFKEVQLRKMRIGQPVTLEADLYGGKVEYKGKIVGLSAGTGSAFSLLPAQNATGNWIKVVQRVPVTHCARPQGACRSSAAGRPVDGSRRWTRGEYQDGKTARGRNADSGALHDSAAFNRRHFAGRRCASYARHPSRQMRSVGRSIEANAAAGHPLPRRRQPASGPLTSHRSAPTFRRKRRIHAAALIVANFSVHRNRVRLIAFDGHDHYCGRPRTSGKPRSARLRQAAGPNQLCLPLAWQRELVARHDRARPLATFMVVLDTSIANVSHVPSISGDLGVSRSVKATWVITSFAVANAIAVAADRLAHATLRRGSSLFTTATVLLFVIASWLCGHGAQRCRIADRCSASCRASCAGPLIPLSQSLLLSSYPKRAKAGHGAGDVVDDDPGRAGDAGPLLGGWISDDFSWSWIFFINIPVGMHFAAYATWVIYKHTRVADAQAAHRHHRVWGCWWCGSPRCRSCSTRARNSTGSARA